MDTTKIQRFFSTTEISSEPKDNSPGTLSGYFHKFHQISDDRGGYRVTFRPGAFSNLKTPDDPQDVQAFRDHDYQKYLARTRNNTLRVVEDAVGGRFSLDLPDTQDGRDTAVLVGREDLVGMSFGYLPGEYKWMNHPEHGPVMEHLSGRLVEVSVVFDPAFGKTNVSLHSLDADPDPVVLASLHEWLGTPRRNRAERLLTLIEI